MRVVRIHIIKKNDISAENGLSLYQKEYMRIVEIKIYISTKIV